MDFQIESGVALPQRARGRKPTNFPLLAMHAPQVGEDGKVVTASFLIRFEDADTEEATAKLVESWRRKLRTYQKSVADDLPEGSKFDTAKVAGGLRVYRTK